MKIEIDLPKFDEFRATGEYRKPLKNEWFLDSDHKMLLTLNDDPNFGDDYVFIYKYNIPKPEPTLLERIEAAYPEYDVVMLTYQDIIGNDSYSALCFGDTKILHINCQSMGRFSGYIYKDNIEYGVRSTYAIKAGTSTLPIAVVFEK